jgi:hypothetical protein
MTWRRSDRFGTDHSTSTEVLGLVKPLGQMGLAGHMAALLGFQPALAQATFGQVAVAFLAGRTAISLGSQPALALAMLRQLVGQSKWALASLSMQV